MERYSFEYADVTGQWHRSGLSHKTYREAADRAVEWMEVCHVNGYEVCVRVVPVSEGRTTAQTPMKLNVR